MKILAIDTSSKICSISILDNNNIIAEKHNDEETTHSQKLMPLINDILNENNLTLDDINLLACCQGPGSFTGIRIGISTVKAFADVKNIPIIGVTSLESLAYNIKENSIIATIIDAKNENVYFAMYELNDNSYTCIYEPTATTISDSIQIINNFKNNKKLVLVGDGSVIHKDFLQANILDCSFASDIENVQTSISVGLSAYDKYNSDSYAAQYSISPIYLKKSQAERTLSGEN